MSAPKLVVKDFTKEVNKICSKFKRDMVLVGVPAEEADRKDDSKINNATILAINEFGSPINNIPAWPVMAIGIKNAQDQIAEHLKAAIQLAFTKGLNAVSIYYNRAGLAASNSIKKVINAQELLPSGRPAPSTLATRKAQGFKGTKALVVTGQVRNSITYVVKGED